MVQFIHGSYGQSVDDDFEKFCERFGRKVRDARKKRGFTQEDMMAEGFSLRHYQRIEAGKSVTLATIWKLSKALSIPPHEFLPKRR